MNCLIGWIGRNRKEMKRIKHYLAAFLAAVLLLQSSIGVLAEETHREEKIFPSGNSYEEMILAIL